MNLINLVSYLPLPVRLFEPHPDPAKPGLSPELRSVVVPGKGHPDGPPAVTRGIDGEVFDLWKDANPKHAWLASEQIKVVSDEEADKLLGPASYGWEPGLEAADMTGVKEGSLAHDVPHGDVDMNAYSNAPNDDSARSQTRGLGPVVPSTPPQDPEAPGAGSGDAPLTHGKHPLETREEPAVEEPRKPRFDPDTGKPIE